MNNQRMLAATFKKVPSGHRQSVPDCDGITGFGVISRAKYTFGNKNAKCAKSAAKITLQTRQALQPRQCGQVRHFFQLCQEALTLKRKTGVVELKIP